MTSLGTYRERLEDSLVHFLWRQWTALGVSSHALNEDPWLIDPEALLLFSTDVARHDPRLFDEIVDWVYQFGEWISLSRLRAIHRKTALGNQRVLAAIAGILVEESRHRKWRVLLKDAREEPPTESLFTGMPIFGPAEPYFGRFGLFRGKLELRGMSQFPRMAQPTTFLFKMRALFGMQSRAEIFAWLLANESGHPAAIARQTGYYSRNVQDTLNEMARSGLVRSIRTEKKKHFAVNHGSWKFLCDWKDPDHFPHWFDWPSLFSGIEAFRKVLAEPEIENKSLRYQAMRVNEARNIAVPAIFRARRGFALEYTEPSSRDPEAHIELTIKNIEALLG